MDLEDFKSKVYKIGNKLGLNRQSNLYPLIVKNKPAFSEGITVILDEEGFHYVIMERGQLLKQIDCNNTDDILYLIFEDITYSLASVYEAEHRKDKEDFRRQFFKKQIALMNKVNRDFSKRRKKEIDAILEKAPYQD